MESSDGAGWRAGTASIEITPQTDTWMAGYGSRDEPSDGVEQDLYATAIALEDENGSRVVAVGADILGFSGEIRSAVTSHCQEAHDLPPESLLLNASHTHCGPEFRLNRYRLLDLSEEQVERVEAFRDRFVDRICTLVAEALADRSPASLSYTHARAGFAMNRRTPRGNDIVNHPYPDGPVDQDVPVVRIDDLDGDLEAVLFSYACHNTTRKLSRFSGDWAGYAKQYLTEDYSDCTPVFLTGCAGNQNPYPRREPRYAKDHGRAMANTLETALQADPTPIEGSLDAAFDTVTLEYERIPTREELTERLEADSDRTRTKARYLLDELDREGALPETNEYPIQALQIGGGGPTIVAMGGEPVVEYSLRLKESLDGPVVPCGYTNAYSGYVPTAEMLAEGGYEGRQWARSSPHPSPYAASTEGRVLEAAIDLGRRVSET